MVTQCFVMSLALYYAFLGDVAGSSYGRKKTDREDQYGSSGIRCKCFNDRMCTMNGITSLTACHERLRRVLRRLDVETRASRVL
jgi:hypothetical protein